MGMERLTRLIGRRSSHQIVTPHHCHHLGLVVILEELRVELLMNSLK